MMAIHDWVIFMVKCRDSYAIPLWILWVMKRNFKKNMWGGNRGIPTIHGLFDSWCVFFCSSRGVFFFWGGGGRHQTKDLLSAKKTPAGCFWVEVKQIHMWCCIFSFVGFNVFLLENLNHTIYVLYVLSHEISMHLAKWNHISPSPRFPGIAEKNHFPSKTKRYVVWRPRSHDIPYVALQK